VGVERIMATVLKLLRLASDFNIPLDQISFQGEHDVVFVHVPDGILPDPETFEDDKSEDEIDQFYETYGIYCIEGYWGFYT
jgi:hypothetical protein